MIQDPNSTPPSSQNWYLYILRTAQGRLYTGITTNITRRLAQHQAGKGAKALRGQGSLTLVYQQPVSGHSAALKLEYQIKQLSKAEKEQWIDHADDNRIAHG